MASWICAAYRDAFRPQTKRPPRLGLILICGGHNNPTSRNWYCVGPRVAHVARANNGTAGGRPT